MKKIPFVANAPDNMHCVNAVFRMVHQYYWGEDLTWDEIDTLTKAISGLATWTFVGEMEFAQKGLEIINIEPLDYKKLSSGGFDYIRQMVGKQTADYYERKSNLASVLKYIPDYLKIVKHETRRATTAEIIEYLKQGYLIGVEVNSRILNHKDGFSLHFVLLFDFDGENIILNDPGDPPIRQRKITSTEFEQCFNFEGANGGIILFNYGSKMIIERLKSKSSAKNITGMMRFGIVTDKALGVTTPDIRSISKKLMKNHSLALKLWETDIHEGRLLAAFIDDPILVSTSQMEQWVKDFNSWDICDQVCGCLFDKTKMAYDKVFDWVSRNEEYVKRAGFVLMATMAVHRKDLNDDDFLRFFPLILKHSVDDRNFVKKAVNWALRQIGKRNIYLHSKAMVLAETLRAGRTKSEQWIGSNALTELRDSAIIKRIQSKN